VRSGVIAKLAASDSAPPQLGGLCMRHVGTILLAAFAVQSCAAVTTGTTQSPTVVTEPAGATCKLTRGESATLVAHVNQTPNTLRIDKSGEIMTIECSKEGYEVTRAYLEPDFQAMTLGNAILGGGIGLMVDAASGAMAKYPEATTVALTPSSFATAEARDTYYGRIKDETAKRWESWSAKLATKCEEDRVRSINGGAAGNVESCQTQRERLEARKAADLQELETNRQKAKIGA
jgi:hypothetical protein